MGIAHSVSVVNSVRVGNIHFIEIQFAAFIPAASLRVHLKGDHLKGVKGSLFSENKQIKKCLKLFMFSTSVLALNIV